MKKIVLIILFALISCVAVLSACSNGKTDESVNNGQKDVQNDVQNGDKPEDAQNTETQDSGASFTITESGITATLTTDKSNYAEGETINYTLTVTNDKVHMYTAKTVVTYTNSEGLVPVDENSMPYNLEQIESGQSAVLTGALHVDSSASKPAAVKNNTKYPSGYEKIELRPYVSVNYAGQEAMIRVVMEFHAYPEKVNISAEYRNYPKYITCHDPSIFKDFDGTYYLLGTHITGGYSSDLRTWTSVDGSFRATFTQETKNKIREWNKDSGDWYGYLWAPDVVYNPKLGKYCYYLSANGDDWKSNIVLLTSDNILGPYEYAGSVVYGGFTEEDYMQTDLVQVLGCSSLPERYITNGIKNRKWGDKWPNCIDPCVFYDDDGNLWMSYGSWSGGIFMLALDEETGLRDYSVVYENNPHSDSYFGKKIAGGWYVSGEGSYIQKIGDYYWLFMSYGNLEARGGYNIRVFRSDKPDGDYYDELGNSPLYDSYIFNYNQSVGVRLFGGYKWRTFSDGQVAQGHNSAFVDDDGKAYIVYHSRTTNGTEGHNVKIHQLFLNEDGWLVAAPYYTDGESLEEIPPKTEDIVGEYEIIIHDLKIDYKNLDVKTVKFINLNADGTITGEYEGTWSVSGKDSYITLTIDSVTYKGVTLNMNVENYKTETRVFTALGTGNSQITIWGSRVLE